MAAEVLYRQGTKAEYLALPARLANALYFCTDTKELFKGDDLYSDGMRVVASFSDLPIFTQAAANKLYVCTDTGCGYVLNSTRDGWDIVVHGVDHSTIGYDDYGLMRVEAVPVELVAGLSEKVNALIDTKMNFDLSEVEGRLANVEMSVAWEDL